VRELNTPVFLKDRKSRPKINKGILELNNIYDKIDLADMYRILHFTKIDYTFLSAVPRTFLQNRPHPRP
jgi:hypothetical protein